MMSLATDLLRDLLEKGRIDLERSIRQPLVVHESVNALRLVELLRKRRRVKRARPPSRVITGCHAARKRGKVPVSSR